MLWRGAWCVLMSAVMLPAFVVGYTWPADTRVQDGDTFDYIVVGAGAAGAAVAARLALAGADVLLVEAGGDPNLLTKIPGASAGLLGSDLDWKYKTIPNNVSCLSSQNQQCRFSRGKCLGGSTSINYMMYIRGNRHDFDQMNIAGWSWDDVEPYFLRYEGLQDLSRLPPSSIPFHNTTGTLEIEFFGESGNSWHSRIFAGFKALNFPYNPDVNAQSQIGVSQVVGYVLDGERMSTARGYLATNQVKAKLKVTKNSRCTGVLIDKNNIAQGVTVIKSYLNGLIKRKMTLHARNEVVLSAGAIGTPQILMLSGIGPAEHLENLGITVRSDLPVGDNMSDHVLPLVFIKVNSGFGFAVPKLSVYGMKTVEAAQWLLKKNGPLASNGLTDVTAFANTLCYNFDKRKLVNNHSKCNLPTLQFINAYVDRNIVQGAERVVEQATGLKDSIVRQISDVNVNYALLVASPVVLRPYSRGSIRLASTDPLDPPFVFANYIADDRDVDEMLRSITILEHLVDTPVYQENDAEIVHLQLDGCPEYSIEAREEYWRCYVRHMTYSVFHAVGTAALRQVVDENLNVLGISRLRVADLGVMPLLPRGNTAATAIAIGERVADLILAGQ